MKRGFGSFEIHPVKKVDGGDSPYDCIEQCEEGDPELHAWAIYGRRPESGLECLADCPSKETAEFLKSALDIACFKHEGLVSAAKMVIDRWERGDLADAVRKLDHALKA